MLETSCKSETAVSRYGCACPNGDPPGEQYSRRRIARRSQVGRIDRPWTAAKAQGEVPLAGKLGVTARELSDQALKRQLRTMWITREETVLHGGAHAIAAHTHRMLELEFEYIARFSRETTPTPARTRRGSRARSGQPPGRR
ncbi:MAG: DUF6158 family protein [Actinomycetota bacterium]